MMTSMELTDKEKWSLSLALSQHTYDVRMVYFKTKRCEDCTEQRSCYEHMIEMANL